MKKRAERCRDFDAGLSQVKIWENVFKIVTNIQIYKPISITKTAHEKNAIYSIDSTIFLPGQAYGH